MGTHKQNALNEYIKEKHTQEECIGFIDGYEASENNKQIDFAIWTADNGWFKQKKYDLWEKSGIGVKSSSQLFDLYIETTK